MPSNSASKFCFEILARDCNPPVLPGISRVTTITMLGVTVSNRLSVTEHVSRVISKCAQSLYAMKVLRCYGMCEDALKIIFKSVIVAKILYASPAWWGFATISDKQRLESFIRRAVRLGFYDSGVLAVTDLVAELDDILFASVLANDSHVLRNLLPDRNDCSCSLIA